MPLRAPWGSRKSHFQVVIWLGFWNAAGKADVAGAHLHVGLHANVELGVRFGAAAVVAPTQKKLPWSLREGVDAQTTMLMGRSRSGLPP